MDRDVVKTLEPTVEEIDGHLTFISSILKYGRQEEKQRTLRKADLWLDQRLRLTHGIPLDDDLLMGGGEKHG